MKALVPLCLYLTSSLLAADEFPEKRLPVDENIWLSNEIVNAQRGRDFVIRRLPSDSSPCNNPDKCPPALIVDVANGNTNVKGKLNATSLYINGQPLINQQGQWVGSTENLRGPQGIQGPKGNHGAGCDITQDSIVCGESIVTLETLRGPKGDRGQQGIQGPQGIRGPEGVQGPQGETGPAGPQGLQGSKGEKGDSCTVANDSIDCGGYKKSWDELRGPRGFQGERGEQGQTGVKGDTGPAGPMGATGATGPKGDTGATGLTGATGGKGERGPSGESCVMGASIYPSCLDGLKGQSLFKIVSSEKVPDDQMHCIDEPGGFQTAVVAQCPSSHPYAVSGSCESIWKETSLGAFSFEASKPVGTSGWRCEASSTNALLCLKSRIRVWLTCTSMGSTAN